MHVKLDIRKALYRDYLNYLFETDPEGTFLVTRNNDFGKLLCSRVQYSEQAKKIEASEKTVVFQLPKARLLANAKNHFLFYSKEDQLKIQEDLEVMFNMDLDRYYLSGVKNGYMQKQIIQSFIVSRKLVRLIGDNETLKKRVYREELENIKKRTEELFWKAYNRNERIDYVLNDDRILNVNYLTPAK